MDNTAILAGVWLFAYAIGAIPTTYLIARLAGGVDLRAQGSGNVGGSNLARQLGKPWMPAIIAIDFTRGGGPLLLAWYAMGAYATGTDTTGANAIAWGLAATPLLTLAGNNWSPFLRLTGGRGVGVWAGGLIAMSPPLFTAALLTYLAAWALTRRSAESLLVVMAALPLAALFWPPDWMLIAQPHHFAAYAGAGGLLILLKRLLGNGKPLADGNSASSVMFNRLLRDRDIADRTEWVSRSQS